MFIDKIEKHAQSIISEKELQQVFFIQPDKVTEFLNSPQEQKSKTEIVQGFRVTTEFENNNAHSNKNIREQLAKILLKKRGR